MELLGGSSGTTRLDTKMREVGEKQPRQRLTNILSPCDTAVFTLLTATGRHTPKFHVLKDVG